MQEFVGNSRNQHYRAHNAVVRSRSAFEYRLPCSSITKTQMTAFEQEFDRLVQAFLDVYDWEIIQSRAKLGDLFNDADYMSVHELAP